MFEEQYRKYCREIKPSEALNDETLALMKEARDHRTAPTPAPLKWKPALILPVTGTAVAAAIAVVIVGVWLTRGNGELNEEAGDMDVAFSDSVASEQAPSDNDNADSFDALMPEDNEEDSPSDSAVSGDALNGGSANNSTGNSGANNSGSPDSSTGDSAGDVNYGSSMLPDEDDKSSSDDEQSTEPAEPNPEPYGPEVSQEKNVKTYLTIREFIDALSQKTAPGYGSNYYNARELLIVPNLLPDGARFRHLHLNTKTGKYSYSYHFTKDGKDYIIDVDVNVVTPKNLNELRLYKEHVADEKILTGAEGDRLYYQFGEQDLVTVTLTDVTATTPLTAEETAALLTQFKLERCSLLNPVPDMKY